MIAQEHQTVGARALYMCEKRRSSLKDEARNLPCVDNFGPLLDYRGHLLRHRSN